MKIIFKIFYVFFIVIIFSCNHSNYKVVPVDFSDTYNIDSTNSDTSEYLKVIVSAMISPKETYFLYKDLFEYVSKKINKKLKFEQRKTYSEVNELLSKNLIDIALICTGAYIKNKENCDLIVTPTFKGQPFYKAYIIVSKSSNLFIFSDLRNKTFAFTDPLSNTGKFYPEKRIHELYGISPDEFFKKIIYSNSHDASIQLVSKGLVDAASVDGLIYEYLSIYSPAKIKNIRILEKSEPFGSPPIVASKKLSSSLKKQIQDILCNIKNDDEGKKILKNLLIDEFIYPNDSIYSQTILYYNKIIK